MIEDPRRRVSDEYDDERWRQRDDPSELRLGWNGKSIRAKGLAVVVGLCAGTIIFAMSYSHSVLSEQHRSLKTSQDRMGCIVTMTIEERARFRTEWSAGAFRRWCPWVLDD